MGTRIRPKDFVHTAKHHLLNGMKSSQELPIGRLVLERGFK